MRHRKQYCVGTHGRTLGDREKGIARSKIIPSLDLNQCSTWADHSVTEDANALVHILDVNIKTHTHTRKQHTQGNFEWGWEAPLWDLKLDFVRWQHDGTCLYLKRNDCCYFFKLYFLRAVKVYRKRKTKIFCPCTFVASSIPTFPTRAVHLLELMNLHWLIIITQSA